HRRASVSAGRGSARVHFGACQVLDAVARASTPLEQRAGCPQTTTAKVPQESLGFALRDNQLDKGRPVEVGDVTDHLPSYVPGLLRGAAHQASPEAGAPEVRGRRRSRG